MNISETCKWKIQSFPHPKVVSLHFQLLLEMENMDPRLQDNKGNTALHEAGIRGDPHILEFLFGADLSLSDLNKQNNEGETPLY